MIFKVNIMSLRRTFTFIFIRVRLLTLNAKQYLNK